MGGERFAGEVVGGRGPGQPPDRGQARALAPIPTLYAANLLFLAALGAYLLLPVYLTGLGASESQVGLVLSATGVANAVTLAWMYHSGERRGPCRLMLAGCAAFGLGSLVILVFRSLWAVAVGRLLHGAGFPLYFVAANAWLAQACPPAERAKQIGFLGIVTLVTQSVAPAASEALVALAGWPALFAVTLGLTAGSAAVLRRLPEPAPGAGGPASETGPAAAGFGVAARLTAVAILGGGAYGVAITFAPLHLQAQGIRPLSLFFIVYALSAVAARWVGREWAHRYGYLRVARLCFVGLGAATAALGMTDDAVTFSAAAALFGVGHGLMYPAVAAYSVEVLPGGSVRALTLWSGGFMIGVSLGVWAGGLVAEGADLATAFLAAGAMPLLAGAALGTQPRPNGPRQDRPPS